MCGLFGIAVTADVKVPSFDRRKVLASLADRGPDASAAREFEGRGIHGVLCHTRLSIIDPRERSNQPFAADDGSLLAYNGELYNFRELAKPHAGLRTSSDTEVVLRCLQAGGWTATRAFNGMFAFAFWNAAADELWLARDPVGIKPLYLAPIPGGLAFASEGQTLLASGLVTPRLNRQAALHYLEWGSIQDPQTLVEGITALAPGAVLRLGRGGHAVVEYPPSAGALPSFAGLGAEDAAEQLLATLRGAVRRQLVADVPVGVFLSGGLDSGGLAALAAEVSSKPIVTMTVGFRDEPELSENVIAKRTAAWVASDHREVLISKEEAGTWLLGLPSEQDFPSVDGANTLIISRAAQQLGLRVCLSGLGGDELFGGYGGFRMFSPLVELIQRRPAIPRVLDALTSPFHLVLPTKVLKAAFAVLGAANSRDLYRSIRSIWTKEQLKWLSPLPTRLPEPPSLSTILPCRNALMRMEMEGYLRNMLLRDTDAMSMGCSLEVRVPLLDREVINLTASLPDAVVSSEPGSKDLLRRALSQVLPDSILGLSKRGFGLPMETWFRRSLRPLIDVLRGPTHVEALGLVRKGRAGRLHAAFLAGLPGVRWTHVWSLAALEHWLRRTGAHADA